MVSLIINGIEFERVSLPTISDCEFCGEVKDVTYKGYVYLKDKNTMTSSDTHISYRLSKIKKDNKDWLHGRIRAYCCKDCAIKLII